MPRAKIHSFVHQQTRKVTSALSAREDATRPDREISRVSGWHNPCCAIRETQVHRFGRHFVFAVVFLAAARASAQQPSSSVFKSGIERVALAAVVRDGKGKLVTNLTAGDFELYDSGHRAPLIGVWSEPNPASVALLLDASGSMATKLQRARE